MKIPVVQIPDRFEQVKSLPDDPPYSRAFCYATSGAECFAMVCPIPAEQAMPYGNPQEVIDGIHKTLGDDQGLIEVEGGITAAGHRFLYSMVKTLQKSGGVQYFLRMNIGYTGCTMQVQGVFDETGMTGVRDSMVYLLLSRQGTVKTTEKGMEGWVSDPYDPSYTRGVCMNCSERREFDAQFPQHPLSEMRRFAAEVIRMN